MLLSQNLSAGTHAQCPMKITSRCTPCTLPLASPTTQLSSLPRQRLRSSHCQRTMVMPLAFKKDTEPSKQQSTEQKARRWFSKDSKLTPSKIVKFLPNLSVGGVIAWLARTAIGNWRNIFGWWWGLSFLKKIYAGLALPFALWFGYQVITLGVLVAERSVVGGLLVAEQAVASVVLRSAAVVIGITVLLFLAAGVYLFFTKGNDDARK